MSKSEIDLQNHLEYLESKVAFQEDAISQMHDELLEHQRRIEKLQRQVLMIAEKLQQGTDSGILRTHEEPPPPHY